MQIARYAVLITLFLGQTFADARKPASIDCTFLKWPYSTETIGKNEMKILVEFDPKKVRAYYLNEVTSPKLRRDLARGLLDFLLSAEPSADVRAFLELTGEAAELKSGRPTPISKSEVCSIAKRVRPTLPEQ